MITKKHLKELVMDEKAGIKEYKKLNWNGLARDEEKHLRFLQMLMKSKK